jgi:hypothetical protein
LLEAGKKAVEFGESPEAVCDVIDAGNVLLHRGSPHVVVRLPNGLRFKLRPAGAAHKKDGFHWAFRQTRRRRADSFKRMLGGTPSR